MYPVQIRIPSECHKCNVFTNLTSTESEIQKAGTQAMQITYRCENANLQKARYSRSQKQAATGKIDPDRLLPTENSTAQHSLRVHLQILPHGSILTLIYLIQLEGDGSWILTVITSSKDGHR